MRATADDTRPVPLPRHPRAPCARWSARDARRDRGGGGRRLQRLGAARAAGVAAGLLGDPRRRADAGLVVDPDRRRRCRTSVSPAATQFDLVFDRVIDGSKIEDTVTVERRLEPAAEDDAAGDGDLAGDGDRNAGRAAPGRVQPGRLVQQHPPADRAGELARTSTAARRRAIRRNTTARRSTSITNGITSKYGEPMAAGRPRSWSRPSRSRDDQPDAGASSRRVRRRRRRRRRRYVPTNFWVPLQFNNIPVTSIRRCSRPLAAVPAGAAERRAADAGRSTSCKRQCRIRR